MEIKETGIKEVDEVLSSINSEPSFDQIVAYQRLADIAAVATRRADDAEKWISALESTGILGLLRLRHGVTKGE